MKKYILLLFIIYLNTAFSQVQQKEQTIEIPVIFHIVDQEFEKGSMKKNKTRIDYLINKMNEGFNDVDEERIEDDYRSIIANCKIKFKLAEVNNGLTWHLTDTEYFEGKKIENDITPYDGNLKKYGYKNSKKYLNIWICKLQEEKSTFTKKEKLVNGYATFPYENNLKNDGVVLTNEILSTTDWELSSSIAIHEIGHWLGLKHIWGDFKLCSSDDGVLDTPKQKKEHTYKDIKEQKIQEVCSSDKEANYQNFMDYSGVYGMFTKGQATVMRNNIFKYRKGFLSNETNTNLAAYQNMTKESFNYYTLSANNLNFKTNTKYLDGFIKDYKEIKPTSEFHLKRLREELKTELQNKINSFDYSKKYKSDYNIGIGKFNFTNNYFPFRTQKQLYEYGYYTLLDEFKIIGKGYGGLTYGYFNLYAVNYKNFNKISLSSTEAEMLLSKLNRRRLYVTVEYSLLKLPLVEHQKIVSMLGYIEKIHFFSDKKRTILVHTINSKTQKSYYDKYKYAILTGSTMSSNINYKFY